MRRSKMNRLTRTAPWGHHHILFVFAFIVLFRFLAWRDAWWIFCVLLFCSGSSFPPFLFRSWRLAVVHPKSIVLGEYLNILSNTLQWRSIQSQFYRADLCCLDLASPSPWNNDVQAVLLPAPNFRVSPSMWLAGTLHKSLSRVLYGGEKSCCSIQQTHQLCPIIWKPMASRLLT
jgi:hypothetical protein